MECSATSSTKKARSHSSRKLRIIRPLHEAYVPPNGTKINGQRPNLKPQPNLPLAAEAPFNAAVIATNAADMLVETLLLNIAGDYIAHGVRERLT